MRRKYYTHFFGVEIVSFAEFDKPEMRAQNTETPTLIKLGNIFVSCRVSGVWMRVIAYLKFYQDEYPYLGMPICVYTVHKPCMCEHPTERNHERITMSFVWAKLYPKHGGFLATNMSAWVVCDVWKFVQGGTNSNGSLRDSSANTTEILLLFWREYGIFE